MKAAEAPEFTVTLAGCVRIEGATFTARAAVPLPTLPDGDTAAVPERALPGRLLPGTGHACVIEDPEGFDAAVIPFLRQLGLWRGP